MSEIQKKEHYTKNMLLEYKADKSSAGKTVKQIIYEHFSLSSRLVTKLKNSGGIKVCGKVVTVRYILKENDVLTLSVDESESSEIEPCDIPIDVIYEDEYILAVNKPKAMPTHPSYKHHNDTLANAVMYRYRDKPFTFRAITRLDEDTSGVVLIARDANTAQKLSKQMAYGKIQKQYLAICDSTPKELCGTIDAPIARDETSVIKRKISPDGKKAVTEYEVIEKYDDGKCLIRVYPKTGRTHQIRLHLSHIGCPINGDFLYGVQVGNERALLHCEVLEFVHPVTGIKTVIKADVPEDMRMI